MSILKASAFRHLLVEARGDQDFGVKQPITQGSGCTVLHIKD